MEHRRKSTRSTSMVNENINYPFYYFYNLKFDSNKILDFIENKMTEKNWIGSGYFRGVRQPNKDHVDEGKLWTANDAFFADRKNVPSLSRQASVKNLEKIGKTLTDFTQCSELVDIMNYFYYKDKPLFQGMLIKKSIKNYKVPFHPIMQNVQFEKGHDINRTFDIIVPIQGGFIESPLEAIDTKTNNHYVLKPKGLAFMIPNDASWHYSWCETKFNFRYTFHLRGFMPNTYQKMRQIYDSRKS